MEQQKEQQTTVTIETPKEEVPKKETKIVDEPEPSTSTGAKAPRPKRGRPKGSNRTPLSQEERRARNAQYEKERREDLAKAQTELMEAAGCKSDVTTAALMAFVITKFNKAKEVEEENRQAENEIRRLNRNLEAQIASCFERLGPDFVLSEDEDEEDKEITRKRKVKQETTVSCDEKRPRVEQPADLAEAGPSTSTVPPQTPITLHFGDADIDYMLAQNDFLMDNTLESMEFDDLI